MLTFTVSVLWISPELYPVRLLAGKYSIANR